MAKPKAQTLQQRFGFLDADLKTPSHDDAMNWLDKNIEEIVKKIIRWENDWSNNLINDLREKSIASAQAVISYCKKPSPFEEAFSKYNERNDYSSIIDWINGWQQLSHQPPPKPSLTIIKRKWEYTIMSGEYIVGFVDMRVQYTTPVLSVEPPFENEKIYQYMHDEKIKIYPDWKVIDAPSWRESDILFEVKTAIPSLGELIRQINMYRAYSKSKFYVVSTDDKFMSQLLAQNIGFVKYPTGEVFKPTSV